MSKQKILQQLSKVMRVKEQLKFATKLGNNELIELVNEEYQ